MRVRQPRGCLVLLEAALYWGICTSSKGAKGASSGSFGGPVYAHQVGGGQVDGCPKGCVQTEESRSSCWWGEVKGEGGIVNEMLDLWMSKSTRGFVTEELPEDMPSWLGAER